MPERTQRDAIEFCHQKAGNTIDGRSNSTHSQWVRLEASIRDDGLERVIENSEAFLKRAREDRSGERTYDTAVTEEFLQYLGR